MPGRQTALFFVSACVLGVLLYEPALRGGPISDDLGTLTMPEIQSLGLHQLAAIFDPRGPVVPVLNNYAPLHALFHALELSLFGQNWVALHAVNVILHALVATQLLVLFARTGVARWAALLAALLFLVHPANVEAVAWISQLKTTASTAFALAALLAHRRRPAVACLLFACALLAKAQAAFAVPVLALLELAGDRGVARPEDRARWLWVGAWVALFALFTAIEAPVLIGQGTAERAEFAADPWLHARSVVAIAARYLVMAATGVGVSALHEPPLATSWSDPWWIAGVVALVAIGVRAFAVLRARRVEAAYWGWALAAYAPVSQVLPFMYLMSDRYLYTVLPGLLGALLLAGQDLVLRLRDDASRRRVQRVATVAACALALFFAVRVRSDRAPVWRSTESYEIDAALHYPDGVTALVLRARGHARRGEALPAVESLRAARAKGWTWIGVLFADPAFDPIRAHPAFRSFTLEMTQQMHDALLALPAPTMQQLEILAQLQVWRGERDAAIATLERAIAVGGASAGGARRSLAQLRAAAR